MADLLAVAGTIAFFAAAFGAVRLCDRIIGPDPVAAADRAPDEDHDAMAGSAHR